MRAIHMIGVWSFGDRYLDVFETWSMVFFARLYFRSCRLPHTKQAAKPMLIVSSQGTTEKLDSQVAKKCFWAIIFASSVFIVKLSKHVHVTGVPALRWCMSAFCTKLITTTGLTEHYLRNGSTCSNAIFCCSFYTLDITLKYILNVTMHTWHNPKIYIKCHYAHLT